MIADNFFKIIGYAIGGTLDNHCCRDNFVKHR
jgi:hypothetical protein